jgi:hypothetical protein
LWGFILLLKYLPTNLWSAPAYTTACSEFWALASPLLAETWVTFWLDGATLFITKNTALWIGGVACAMRSEVVHKIPGIEKGKEEDDRECP